MLSFGGGSERFNLHCLGLLSYRRLRGSLCCVRRADYIAKGLPASVFLRHLQTAARRDVCSAPLLKLVLGSLHMSELP